MFWTGPQTTRNFYLYQRVIIKNRGKQKKPINC